MDSPGTVTANATTAHSAAATDGPTEGAGAHSEGGNMAHSTPATPAQTGGAALTTFGDALNQWVADLS